MKREGKSRYDEVHGHGGMKAGCPEPDNGLPLVRRSESSPDSEGPTGFGACKTHSCGTVFIAVIKVRSPMTWRGDFTTTWYEYGGTIFSRYLGVQRKGMGNEAEECVTVRSLEPFIGQAENKMVAGGMEDVEIQRSFQTTRKRCAEDSVTEKCFVETRWWWSTLC